MLYVRTLPETDNDARAEEVPKFETIPSEDVDTSPVRPPIEVTPVLLRVFPDQESPVPAEIRFDGVDQNSERFVVEDVSMFVIAVSAEVDALKVFVMFVKALVEALRVFESNVSAVADAFNVDTLEFNDETLELREPIDVTEFTHSVVDAVRGIVYPEATENAPVELLYTSPVADDEIIGRMYDDGIIF